MQPTRTYFVLCNVCIEEANAFGKIPFARSNEYEVTRWQFVEKLSNNAS
jgi:hypothetical protein